MGLFKKIFNKKQDDQQSMQNNEYHQTEPHDKITVERTIDITDGISLLEKHKSGLLDDKSFFSSFGKVNVFYSTPFGDHKDGGSRLFVLPAQDKTAYLPVFTSIERAKDFYDKVGRVGFVIMENSFTSFLETTKKINQGNTPIKFGAVIDPGYYSVTINANSLHIVIDMTV
ncbi:MAG: SseB family protein [Eubacteriales bacterium]|nr:SseB family protein [Eubacteriales bacterium]